MNKDHNPVAHPTHYNCREINCTKCGQRMEAGTICEVFTFWLGNCFKYLYRSDYKGKQIEDLKKAKQCIDMEIAKLTATTVYDVPTKDLSIDWEKEKKALAAEYKLKDTGWYHCGDKLPSLRSKVQVKGIQQGAPIDITGLVQTVNEKYRFGVPCYIEVVRPAPEHQIGCTIRIVMEGNLWWRYCV